MGIAVGDYLNNGLLDFAISDFSDESKLLFHNEGAGRLQRGLDPRWPGQESIPFLVGARGSWTTTTTAGSI